MDFDAILPDRTAVQVDRDRADLDGLLIGPGAEVDQIIDVAVEPGGFGCDGRNQHFIAEPAPP